MGPGTERTDQTLHLIGGPHFRFGDRQLAVPEGSKRLVAYLALHGGVADRRIAAGSIWPDVDCYRAAGNLRSAIWRLRCAGIDVLIADKHTLSFCPGLHIDLDGVREWGARIVGGLPVPEDLDCLPLVVQALEVLPGCYDDWIQAARDELRMSMLDALDALVGRLVAAGRGSDAVEAAMAAVGAEPLRETSQRALILAHLAEGNRGEALRSYLTYEHLLARELGVRPPADITHLLLYAAPRRPTRWTIPAQPDGGAPFQQPERPRLAVSAR